MRSCAVSVAAQSAAMGRRRGGPLGFENTYALAIADARAAALGLRRISDLAPHAHNMEVGGDYELFGRPEWQAIRDTYGLRFAAERAMDPSLM